MESPREAAKLARGILLRYYPEDHFYIEKIEEILNVSDVDSKEFTTAVGYLGWSGMGGYFDSLFCGVDVPLSELTSVEIEFYRLMYIVGKHALHIDPLIPNRPGIEFMLGVWETLPSVRTDK